MSIQLSANERMIMEAIWMAGRPLSRQEILEAVEGKSSWNPASIHLVLNSLVRKGAITILDNASHYGRTYESTLSRSEYVSQYAQSVSRGRTRREQILDVATALVNQKGVDEEVLNELEEMLAQRRAELAKGRQEEKP